MTQNQLPTKQIDLNVQQVNVIVAALQKLPIEVGLDTFMYVTQWAQQNFSQSAPPGPLSDKVIN